jgi:hypothetical protein
MVRLMRTEKGHGIIFVRYHSNMSAGTEDNHVHVCENKYLEHNPGHHKCKAAVVTARS